MSVLDLKMIYDFMSLVIFHILLFGSVYHQPSYTQMTVSCIVKTNPHRVGTSSLHHVIIFLIYTFVSPV